MRSNLLGELCNEQLTALQRGMPAINESAMVSVTDTDGKILYVNDKFTEISRYAAEELIGQGHCILKSGHHPDDFFKEMWETIGQGKLWWGEIKNKAKDGGYYWVDAIITPVLDECNTISRYLSFCKPIAGRKDNDGQKNGSRQECTLREHQLRNTLNMVKTGSWRINMRNNSLEWSEETYRIFETPASTPLTYETFLEKVHPEDRSFVDAQWRAAIKGIPYEIEHRIITPGGEKWVSEKAQLELDEAFNPKAAIGIVQDITEKKRKEHLLMESSELYQSLFHRSPFPQGIVSRETLRFIEVNEALIRLFGYSKEEFQRLTVMDVRIPEEEDKLKVQPGGGNCRWDKIIRSYRKKNGNVVYAEHFIVNISYKGEPAIGFTINDVTDKLNLQEQLISEKIRRQKEISRASLEAQEQNRAEIGRELHDNVNQLLVASKLYFKKVHPVAAGDKEMLDKGINLVGNAMNEIRKLSGALVPHTLRDLSLKESIEDLSYNLTLAQVAVEFHIEIKEDVLPTGLGTNIYRIIQEQFNNIIKYAGATRVKITMTQETHLLTLEIADNGKGFDPKTKSRGIGLNNIIHRAETYNGRACIERSPGNGCRIYIEFAV